MICRHFLSTKGKDAPLHLFRSSHPSSWTKTRAVRTYTRNENTASRLRTVRSEDLLRKNLSVHDYLPVDRRPSLVLLLFSKAQIEIELCNVFISVLRYLRNRYEHVFFVYHCFQSKQSEISKPKRLNDEKILKTRAKTLITVSSERKWKRMTPKIRTKRAVMVVQPTFVITLSTFPRTMATSWENHTFSPTVQASPD